MLTSVSTGEEKESHIISMFLVSCVCLNTDLPDTKFIRYFTEFVNYNVNSKQFLTHHYFVMGTGKRYVILSYSTKTKS